jgi:hypothetical protein
LARGAPTRRAHPGRRGARRSRFWSILAFLVAAKKLVVGIAAIGAFFRKLFGGKKTDARAGG